MSKFLFTHAQPQTGSLKNYLQTIVPTQFVGKFEKLFNSIQNSKDDDKFKKETERSLVELMSEISELNKKMRFKNVDDGIPPKLYTKSDEMFVGEDLEDVTIKSRTSKLGMPVFLSFDNNESNFNMFIPHQSRLKTNLTLSGVEKTMEIFKSTFPDRRLVIIYRARDDVISKTFLGYNTHPAEALMEIAPKIFPINPKKGKPICPCIQGGELCKTHKITEQDSISTYNWLLSVFKSYDNIVQTISLIVSN